MTDLDRTISRCLEHVERIEREKRDPEVDPIRGDEIRTRGYIVLIETVDESTVSYRYRQPHSHSWSRVFTQTLVAYRQWPITEVIKHGDQ